MQVYVEEMYETCLQFLKSIPGQEETSMEPFQNYIDHFIAPYHILYTYIYDLSNIYPVSFFKKTRH